MRLSIITITYNNSNGLLKTLESCTPLLKTVDSEIIVIDGGSKDNTLEILDNFKQTCGSLNFSFVSEKDKGIYDAMNKGIARARGRHAVFMNAGDTFHGGFMLPEMDPGTAYYGNTVFIDQKQARFTKSYNLNSSAAFLNHNCFCHQAIFYPVTLLKQLGGYDLSFRISSDFDLTLRAFLKCQFRPLNTIVSVCELGGVSHVKGMESYRDRMRSFWRNTKPISAAVLALYAPVFIAKHQIVRALDGTALLQAYRRIRNQR